MTTTLTISAGYLSLTHSHFNTIFLSFNSSRSSDTFFVTFLSRSGLYYGNQITFTFSLSNKNVVLGTNTNVLKLCSVTYHFDGKNTHLCLNYFVFESFCCHNCDYYDFHSKHLYGIQTKLQNRIK